MVHAVLRAINWATTYARCHLFDDLNTMPGSVRLFLDSFCSLTVHALLSPLSIFLLPSLTYSHDVLRSAAVRSSSAGVAMVKE
jgi:hypothetical protein